MPVFTPNSAYFAFSCIFFISFTRWLFILLTFSKTNVVLPFVLNIYLIDVRFPLYYSPSIYSLCVYPVIDFLTFSVGCLIH